VALGGVTLSAASVLFTPSDSAFARDVMRLEVQAVHRVACLVEPLRLESPLASEQETEHRLNQVAGCARLLWGKVDSSP
jgi:hypothetical protein